MNIQDDGWGKTFELLKGLFPSADITQDQYDIWQDDLAPMNQEDVRIAIKQHWREKNWKTPRLPAVKSIIYQIRENRASQHDSVGQDNSTEEYEEQQIRLSRELTLERLMDTPVDLLHSCAQRAREKYSMVLSRSSGDDPRDWSVIFRAAVMYVMDGDQNEADRDECPGELAEQQR